MDFNTSHRSAAESNPVVRTCHSGPKTLLDSSRSAEVNKDTKPFTSESRSVGLSSPGADNGNVCFDSNGVISLRSLGPTHVGGVPNGNGDSGGGSGSSGGSGRGRLYLPCYGPAAINELKPFASKALVAIGSAGHSIKFLAEGVSQEGFLNSKDVSLIADHFSKLFQDASNMAAAGENIKLSTVREDDVPDIVNMQHGLNNLRDLLKEHSSDITSFIANPPSGVEDFKRIAAQFGEGGMITVLSGVSLDYIIHYGDPKNHDIRDDQAAATATLPSWIIMTVPWTSKEAFEDFVSKLPDHGSGRRMIYPSFGAQNYVTRMTLEEAKAASKDAIVDQLVPDELIRYDVETFGLASIDHGRLV